MSKKRNFKERLFKVFILIGVLPLLFMTIFSYYNTSNLINEKINSSIDQNIVIMSRYLDSSISHFDNMTKFIAENKQIQKILKKGKYTSYDERFEDFKKIYNIILSIIATQKVDIPIYILGLKNLYSRFSNQEYFASIYADKNSDLFKLVDAKEDKKIFYVHRRVDGKENRDVVLAVGRQIRNMENDEKLGYVFLDIYDDYFNDVFKTLKVYEGNNIYVLDKNGKIISDKLYKNKTGAKFYEEYLDTILNNNEGNFVCYLDGEKQIAYFNTLSNTHLKIVETVPMSVIYKDKRIIVQTFIILLISFVLLAIFVSFVLSGKISRPINELSKLMHKAEKGDLNVNFNLKCNDEIGDLGKSFNKMIKELQRLIEEVYVKQLLLKEAEFKNLKAQVNPHFLYNTLQSIKYMSKLGKNEGVVTMTTALGKFLRYSISRKGDIVTVKEAVEQIKNYITIQKIRHTDKFIVDFQIEDQILDKKILKLLLQPLVENAIIHGLEPKLGKGKMLLKGYISEDKIYFEIIDDGIGIEDNIIKGEGIGISNVNKRIKLQYGEEYGAHIDRINNNTIAKIVVPCNYEES